jgi:hypothetical protein
MSEDVDCIDLTGDAHILLTAPFFPSADSLVHRLPCVLPVDDALDANDRLVKWDRSMDLFLRGSLTYGNPRFELLTHFVGTNQFSTELTAIVDRTTSLPSNVTVTGMFFPDGFGSVAVRITVPAGWTINCRQRLLDGFGPRGRDLVADELRTALLPPLAELSNRCSADVPVDTLLPYFNLTYVAATSHPWPGRATLPDDLRLLVYPQSPAPITSDSSWADEFFFAGYAFSLLASAAPQQTLDQLEVLLLHLDVLYSRLERGATAADQLIREHSRDKEIDWLIWVESRLRADYQALVRPTFSYDYHVLKLRDSLLSAWETDKIRERTDTLLQMARQAVERQLARQQAHRVSQVNLIVTILTLLSVVGSIDAALNLWTRLFP